MRKSIANISWIFLDKVSRMLISMLISVWIARYLGPAEFGVLNYALLFPTIFASVAGFGLVNVLMVEFMRANSDRIKQHVLLQAGLCIKLTAGFLTYGLSCWFNYIFNRDNPELLWLINVTGTVLILQSSDLIDTYFQSQTKARLSVLIKLSAFGLASAMRIYALISHANILFLVLINSAELLIVYIILINIYQRHMLISIIHIHKVMSFEPIRHLITIAWPIMVTEFFVFIYMKVDQFMIESLSTNRELGLYGAALRLSEAWYFISIAINTSLYPKIAEYWSTDKEKFYRHYQDLLNILTYISILLAILVTVISNPLIDLLYGPNFHKAGIILSVHIWAGIFVFTGVGTTNLMIVANLQKFVLLKTILGAIINILLNLWLIPDYGALGASIATLLSYSLQAYGMNLLSKRSWFIFNLQSRAFINFITLQRPLSVKLN